MKRTVLPALVALALLTACPSEPVDNNFGEVPPTATLRIKTLDTSRFDPPVLRARAGQELTFIVENPGKERHQLVLGDGSEVSVTVAPGGTEEATATFAEPVQIEFACRIDDNDKRGMIGRLTVS